jgi:hypothetical protein
LERRRKEKKLLLFLPIDYCSVSSFASVWSSSSINDSAHTLCEDEERIL